MDARTVLDGLIFANLAGGAAIAAVLALRAPVRNMAGSRAAYLLWLVPPFAAVASFLPARTTDVAPMQAMQFGDGSLVAAAVSPALPFDWRIALLAVWLAGALIAVIRLAVAHHAALRRLGRMTPHGKDMLQAQASDIGPAVIGVFKPRIILPADFERKFDAAERTVVLAHEHAHLTGGHVAAKTLAQLLLCLNWFNPLIHVAASRLAVDQELACDETVVSGHPKSRRAYATALLKVQSGVALPLGCCWPSPSARLLKQRVSLVVAETKGLRSRMIGVAAVTVLALGAGVAAWAAQPPRPVSQGPLVSSATPREGDAASRVTAARPLLADAVPSKPEGETTMPTAQTPGRARRLAGAAVVAALGLGTGSTVAAAPDPQLTNARAPAPAVAPESEDRMAVFAVAPIGGDGQALTTFSGRRTGPQADPARLAAGRAALAATLGLPANADGGVMCRLTVLRGDAGATRTEDCTYSAPGVPPVPISAEAMAKLRAQGVVPPMPPLSALVSGNRSEPALRNQGE